jgi:glycosyltransferase involved in cell wall biosynthesis
MIIAVNTRHLLEEPEGYGYFISELFKIVVREHPEHQFYFLFDRPYNDKYIYSSNVRALVVSPPARLPFLWKYWYDIKVPIILRKIKADIFISPDGFCSLSAKLPQYLILHDLGFLHQSEGYKKTHVRFLKKYTPKFLRKAKQIITVSKFSKDDILKHYKITPEKIDVVYNGVKPIFRPLSNDEKHSVKEKYTEGKEYFVYVGAIHPRKNLVNLLKAFSVFKKRLQSNMKLVIAGRLAWKNEEFLKLINTYKYRDDVIMTGYIEEEQLVLLMGSAYALVYPSLFEGFGVPVVEAMKCDVPVLTSSKTSMEEIAGEAALYFDPKDYADIAEKMMQIYKNESLRKQLIEKAKSIAEQYSWKKSAQLFWDSISKTVQG